MGSGDAKIYHLSIVNRWEKPPAAPGVFPNRGGVAHEKDTVGHGYWRDIDDAVCLAYLLREPECQLLGITTVCGQPEKRAAVADAICRAAGREVPIVAGLDSTMQPVPIYPTPEGAGALENWPHNTYEKGDAPAFLYQKIRENPGETVLLGIGNMTNIATLFRSYPDAAGLLKGLYVMNGYFGGEPLPEPWYNWNSRAGEIFRADSDLTRAVLDFGGAWLESAGKLTLHDPLAAVAIFHPDICGFERGFVTVETARESYMGGTVFHPSPEGNLEIARTVDRERFYHILGTTLLGA